jgi:hypothetical protein
MARKFRNQKCSSPCPQKPISWHHSGPVQCVPQQFYFNIIHPSTLLTPNSPLTSRFCNQLHFFILSYVLRVPPISLLLDLFTLRILVEELKLWSVSSCNFYVHFRYLICLRSWRLPLSAVHTQTCNVHPQPLFITKHTFICWRHPLLLSCIINNSFRSNNFTLRLYF